MDFRRLVFSILIVAIVAAAVGIGAWALMISTSTTVEAGPCHCPRLYAPVICDNGKTYPNQCVADCRNADNCAPTGDI
jgi:hypothetical protein